MTSTVCALPKPALSRSLSWPSLQVDKYSTGPETFSATETSGTSRDQVTLSEKSESVYASRPNTQKQQPKKYTPFGMLGFMVGGLGGGIVGALKATICFKPAKLPQTARCTAEWCGDIGNRGFVSLISMFGIKDFSMDQINVKQEPQKKEEPAKFIVEELEGMILYKDPKTGNVVEVEV